MKEIKFRAWHEPSKIMLDLIAINFSLMQITADIENRKIYPELDYWWKETDIPFSEIVLMQSTGLFDKNGKEIYEGDILGREFYVNAIVSYDDGAFEQGWNCHRKHRLDQDFCSSREVIGNIYENSEL